MIEVFHPERLGWRFIRIRGSEYFRDPAKAMKRVVSELAVARMQLVER